MTPRLARAWKSFYRFPTPSENQGTQTFVVVVLFSSSNLDVEKSIGNSHAYIRFVA